MAFQFKILLALLLAFSSSRLVTSKSWRSEKVISALYYERPLLLSEFWKDFSGYLQSWTNYTLADVADYVTGYNLTHDGVVVNTDGGNSFLIHNTPGSGVVATYAKYMSRNWKINHTIPVNGDKTVQDVMTAASAPWGHITGNGINYVISGLCYGAAASAEQKLRD